MLGDMFSADADFSLVDEDFFLDDFQSISTGDLVHERSDENGKQVCSGGIPVKSPMPTSCATSENKARNCSDNENRNCSDNENKTEKLSFKFKPSIGGCVDNFASNDSFLYDDSSNYKFKRDNESIFVVSTPSESCNQKQSDKEIKAYSETSCHNEKDLFRSRILEKLRGSKCLKTVTHNQTASPLNSINHDSVKNVLNDRKRNLPDAPEVRTDGRSLSFKKPHIQNHEPGESYPLNSAHSSESNVVLTDNFKVYQEIDLNSQNKNSIPVGNNTTISPKSVPAKTWKTSSPNGLLIQKRKFPGPAGILPQLGSNVVPDNQKINEKSPATITQDIVCSQNTAYDFSRGTWQQMISDLELNHADPVSPLQVFNIKWVLRRASLRGQASLRKVPFLAVLVRSLDLTHNDATVRLKDPTGEMNGTIASSVMDEYGPALQCGSVLLLHGVTVLSPVGLRATTTLREHTRRHYLNITLNTVLTIYTLDDCGGVIKTLVGKLDKGKLCKQAAAPEIAGGSRAIVEEEEDEVRRDFSPETPSLFSSMNESFGNTGSRLNKSATMVKTPDYKSPRFASNITKCTSAQPLRLSQESSPVSSMQIRGHLGNSGPRMISPNRQAYNPRLPTSSTHLQPQFHQLHMAGTSPVNSNHSKNHRFLASNNVQGEGLEDSLPSPKTFSSQAEEKEIRDLLDGVDTDSLFGDF